jgi:hypothetical protein
MQSTDSDDVPPCEAAYEHFLRNEKHPVSENLPPTSESDRTYVPKHIIEDYLSDKLRLEAIFLCPCRRCTRSGGPVSVHNGQDRQTHWGEAKMNELQGTYMMIYALLIYIREPGYIGIFRKHELTLDKTSYLHRSHLEVLRGEGMSNDDFDHLANRILRKQYSISVRILEPYADLTVIPAKELLPIKEDPKPKGEGAFAKVTCFEFQSDEYRSPKFGDVRCIDLPTDGFY